MKTHHPFLSIKLSFGGYLAFDGQIFGVISHCILHLSNGQSFWRLLYLVECLFPLIVPDLKQMRRIGVVYFLYLFFYSGLEFTLTFLTHNRFNYDRLVTRWQLTFLTHNRFNYDRLVTGWQLTFLTHNRFSYDRLVTGWQLTFLTHTGWTMTG